MLLEHALGPQVGGLEVPDSVSPKAGIVVGTYIESIVRVGKVGVLIVVDKQSSGIVMVNNAALLMAGSFTKEQSNSTR